MGKDKMLPVALAALAGVVAATNPNPGETVVIGDHVGVYAGLTCTYFEGGPTLGDVVASAVALGLATGSCQDVTHYRNTRDAVCLTSGDASGFSCGTSSSGSFLACPTAPCEDPCDNLRVIRCLGADCSQASNDAGTFGIHELFLFDTDGVANNDCGGSAGSIGDPRIVDFAGHVFIGGNAPNSEYLLYESAGGQGHSRGLWQCQGQSRSPFVRGVWGHMHDQPHAKGDDGMVLVPMSSGTMVAVNPHPIHESDESFLNVKLLNPTKEFRAGCKGMLCSEDHTDIVV